MTATVIVLLAAIGFFIAVIIFLKGNKSSLALLIGIMSIVLLVVGINGYREIKRDAYIYQPLAAQWLEDKKAESPEDKSLNNYSIYCIYYSPDKMSAVVYVELPSAKENLVMVFKRANKKLDEIHLIPKEMKPEASFQNKLDPAIFFY